MADDPGDIDLVKSDQEDPSSVPRSWGPVALLAAAGALTLALAGGYLFLRRGPSQPSVPGARTQPAVTQPAPQAESGEQIPLPPLDEMDALVRQPVSRLSSHPTVMAWLTTDGLIVNFVVVTRRIADGQTPAAELKALGPVPPFQTRASPNIRHIDPSSYRRYDRYAEAVSALDARGAARLYATLKPRVLDADRQLGGPDAFDSALERAIVELLRVPVVEREVALKPQGVGYAFADPHLEEMSAAQKQLLRMGPQNVRAVQGKLREIASHLGIPESRLPSPPLAK